MTYSPGRRTTRSDQVGSRSPLGRPSLAGGSAGALPRKGLEITAGSDQEARGRICRRQLLKRGATTLGGLVGVALVGRADPTAASARVLSLSQFGARGDGHADDTAAIQAALNAAPSGTTVLGETGATYVVSDTLSFPADQVTLDLGGASIRMGKHGPAGSQLQANDTIFSISGRTGVRITNGKIARTVSGHAGSGISRLGRLAALGTLSGATGNGGMPYLIHIVGGQNCQVDHLTAACDGSLFAYLYGSGHSISHNKIESGGIAGLATRNATVQGNTLTDSPADAISFTGFQGAPVVGTRYLNNTISGYGRVGIEEYSPDSGLFCISPTFVGNTIASPSAANTSGTGISAISTRATVKNNKITDAEAWGIEATGLGTTVSGNQIDWSSRSKAALESTAIVINTSLPSDTEPVIVRGNTINRGATGIELFGSAFYGPVTIEANQLKNIAQKGIVLAPAAKPGLVQVKHNVVSFDNSPAQGDRSGIVTAAGAVLTANKVD